MNETVRSRRAGELGSSCCVCVRKKVCAVMSAVWKCRSPAPARCPAPVLRLVRYILFIGMRTLFDRESRVCAVVRVRCRVCALSCMFTVVYVRCRVCLLSCMCVVVYVRCRWRVGTVLQAKQRYIVHCYIVSWQTHVSHHPPPLPRRHLTESSACLVRAFWIGSDSKRCHANLLSWSSVCLVWAFLQ